tara:strand:- start:913 stop:1590 length:678 start_codon:yes stop_codon:yes gene_type:complete
MNHHSAQIEFHNINSMAKSINNGIPWPNALLNTISNWSTPEEIFEGKKFQYFISEEAFDLFLLAERICISPKIKNLIPSDEITNLVVQNKFPPSFDTKKIKTILGFEKYRAHMNFFYGITIEETLQLATELEIYKNKASIGIANSTVTLEEIFNKIYGDSDINLIKKFFKSKNKRTKKKFSLTEYKELTYWLFHFRIQNSDKAKLASDTKKAIKQLKSMEPKIKN